MGLSDMQGEGPVKYMPPKRAPHVAVAARKWLFAPVLRADWKALRSTGLCAPSAANCNAVQPRTRPYVVGWRLCTPHKMAAVGQHQAAHVKREGSKGGNLCTWHARRGSSSSPDGKSRRLESPARPLKATQMASLRVCALPVTDAQCISCEMGGMADAACRSMYRACRAHARQLRLKGSMKSRQDMGSRSRIG